jgi:serine/threonine-protein kinase
MGAEDWRQVEELFHTALGLNSAVRGEYLASACRGDGVLLGEVESLLSAFDSRSGFLEEPAFSLGMSLLSSAPADSLTGKTVGPYKIIKALGGGGMGQVYLAEDTRLGRKVALKFLSEKLSEDNWAKRQLTKEAQAVAQLDHPNICAVYGLEEEAGHTFIVMQYIEGETLADLIRRSPPDVKQALTFAAQMTGALAEAHSHGILHRDIKPSNVMVTAGGQSKILDFGLATFIQQRQDAAFNADASTEFSHSGLIIGTVAYMSPEQLRAERLDFRSDIFSFGTLLYELFSGENPFAHDNQAETISAILTSRPAHLTRRGAAAVPQELNRIVLKCLEKEKERRYQSASELLIDLQNLQDESSFRRARKSLRAVALVALLIILFVGSAVAYMYATRVRTLAVLPLVNEGGDPGNEYLSDGLSDNLIGKLSRLSRLRVTSPTIVSGYKGRAIDPQAAGRELHVDAVLVGKLIQRGEFLTVEARLISTDDGAQLWAYVYDGRMTDIIGLQDQLSERIASGLQVWMASGEKRSLTAHNTDNPEAFRQYMLGRNYWGKRDRANIQKAIECFKRAVDLDPNYADAYAGLADSYVVMNTVPYGPLPTKEVMTKARAMANQALTIDDTLCEAHTSLGVVKLKYDWDWQGAAAEFRRALVEKPDYALAHYWYANLQAVLGNHEESIAESKSARDLDPLSPLAEMNLGRAYYFARQYDMADAHFTRMLKSDPNDLKAKYLLSLTYIQKGMYGEAAGLLESFPESDSLFAAAPLGYAYAKLRRKDEALKVLGEVLERSKNVYVPPLEVAIIYIGLGDRDEAFKWLDKAYDERFSSLIYLTADPLFDDLHQDARFADLAARLKLAH